MAANNLTSCVFLREKEKESCEEELIYLLKKEVWIVHLDND